MSYQVFARKYRPRTFADVLGQDHVVRTLRNAIQQGRLAHAYLFVGPRGTGKTSTARIFAKALNCSDGPKVEFDPEEDICREIAEGRSLDVLEIDGASNNGVEQVRELRENVKFAPARCRFKIYYIDEVHMLSSAAFNALLKTLEEPPPHVKFIFATTEPNKILPTIISRCQRFDLRRIPNAVIAEHLLHIAKQEKVKLDEKAAYAIAKGAEGGMRDAQSMLDQLVAFCGETIGESDVLEVFGFTSAESVARLSRAVLERDTVGALQTVHEQSEAGKDLSRLLSDMIQHFRTLLVQQADPAAAKEDLSPEIAAEVAQQAKMATTEQLLRMVDCLAEVDARMRWASNKRLHLELGVIQAVQCLCDVSLSDVIAAIDASGGTAATPAASAPQRTAQSAAVAAPRKTATISSVKEEPPASKPSSEPAPTAQPSPVEGAQLWEALLAAIQEKRPLISNWIRVGTLLAQEKGMLKIGFPTSETHARDSLMREATRKFIESTLHELAGGPLRLDLVVDASLKPVEPPPAPPPEPESSPPAGKAAPDQAKAQEESGEQKNAEFYNDPLINAAIEKFKARILPGNEGLVDRPSSAFPL